MVLCSFLQNTLKWLWLSPVITIIKLSIIQPDAFVALLIGS